MDAAPFLFQNASVHLSISFLSVKQLPPALPLSPARTHILLVGMLYGCTIKLPQPGPSFVQTATCCKRYLSVWFGMKYKAWLLQFLHNASQCVGWAQILPVRYRKMKVCYLIEYKKKKKTAYKFDLGTLFQDNKEAKHSQFSLLLSDNENRLVIPVLNIWSKVSTFCLGWLFRWASKLVSPGL